MLEVVALDGAVCRTEVTTPANKRSQSEIWILKVIGGGWATLGVLVLKNNLGSPPMRKQTNMKEEADNPNREMDQKTLPISNGYSEN